MVVLTGDAVVVFSIIINLCTRTYAEAWISKIVLTEQGPVRGYKNPKSGLFEFHGIPYASASRRYQAPSPPQIRPNTSIFEAVDKGIVCMQGVNTDFDIHDKTKILQEDCLKVNIFVPETEKKKIPVLIYIHGGLFHFGYGNIKPVTNFAKDYDIIAVNFNYRLGVLGNVCLGTESVPSNAAMKDQIALLKWVNKNIAFFGGDPKKVTLAGCSSGGSSAELVGLSKASNGLVRNMIIASSNSLDKYAVQQKPKEIAIEYMESLQLPNKFRNMSLETIYKSIPLKYLVNRKFISHAYESTLIFSPCIDGSSGTDSVMEEAPYNQLKKNKYSKIPILYSFTQMEASQQALSYNSTIKMMKKRFTDFLPGDLTFKDEAEKETLAKLVYDFYFRDKFGIDESIAYIDYFSDILFVYGILKAVELHLEAGHDKVYLQHFSYTDENSPFIPNTALRRAEHCSQAHAVWDEDHQEISEEYKIVKKTMRDIWANFIKTGEPSPKGSKLPAWPPVSSKIGPVMRFDKNMELMESLDQSFWNRFQFWNKIYAKYYHAPEAPI